MQQNRGIPLRPVGHVTELRQRLERWRDARIAKQLDVRDLNRAIAYLDEYRELIVETKTLHRLAAHD